MILTFITLTNDPKKVPVWKCASTKKGTGPNLSCFIKTDVFPKRIMLLGPNAAPPYAATENTEIFPGVFVSTMQLPYTDFYVAGDDLRPFIEGLNPEAPHKHVVVFLIDRDCNMYLDYGVGEITKTGNETNSLVLNTFHAKEWTGCIAAIGDSYKHGKDGRMVGMHVNYSILNAPRASMLHEITITKTEECLGISDYVVDDGDTAKKLLGIYKLISNGGKRRSFRIHTVQRLSNLVVIPEGTRNPKEIFAKSPADYLDNPYGIEFITVPVDEKGDVIDNDVVKNCIMRKFARSNTNRNRSVIFYNCRPSRAFFDANLSYIFVANEATKKKPISYLSIVCP